MADKGVMANMVIHAVSKLRSVPTDSTGKNPHGGFNSSFQTPHNVSSGPDRHALFTVTNEAQPTARCRRGQSQRPEDRLVRLQRCHQHATLLQALPAQDMSQLLPQRI